VLQAALRLVDERGRAALSMRALGGALGVEAMSLYAHVPSKAALLDGVVETMLEELAAAGPAAGGWPAALTDFGRRSRALARRHPEAFLLLVERPQHAYLAGREATTALLEALRAGGLDAPTAIAAVRTVVRYVIGVAAAERAGADEDPPPGAVPADGGAPVDALVARIGPGQDEALFEWGLAAIVAGIGCRGAAPGA
jgi:AcrR family transcriptional regulator